MPALSQVPYTPGFYVPFNHSSREAFYNEDENNVVPRRGLGTQACWIPKPISVVSYREGRESVCPSGANTTFPSFGRKLYGKNTWFFHTSTRMVELKKTKNTKCGKDKEPRILTVLVGGDRETPLWKTAGQHLLRLNTCVPSCASNCTLMCAQWMCKCAFTKRQVQECCQ